MADQEPEPRERPIIVKPGQPAEFPGIGADPADEVSTHDQHAARERRAEQMGGADGGRWDPTGQSKVGGP